MKRFLAFIVAFCCCISLVLPSLATEYSNSENAVCSFIQYISEDDDYSIWIDATPVFAYELYASDLDSVVGYLYYVVKSQSTVGYVIVNNHTLEVMEFSRDIPAYDKMLASTSANMPKRLYINGMPSVLQENIFSSINQCGDVISAFNIESNAVLRYSPQLQTKNCIVSAISNLMWHWSINGYPDLTTGMSFNQVENRVDYWMTYYGGYANNNIPPTIYAYVGERSGYSVGVTNQWYPSFNNVANEVANRPCLLGFAAGSPYSQTVGHMTVCVGTRTVGTSKYVKVMDGWETYVVEKLWGNYNDFISKVGITS